MSWIRESSFNLFETFCINILKYGHIPQHVAFIMDGNRRYAKKKKVEKIDGHTKGFEKLSETLQWCLEIGIQEVTVYAFSIENFKRSKEEVDGLMDLAREKFKKLLEEKDKLMEKGVKIRIIGNRSLIPVDIVKLFSEAELMTKNNNKAVLNLAYSYTSQDEIVHGVNLILKGISSNDIRQDDINDTLFLKCLYTGSSKPPDIIIRTSGEKRLSDFLLYQSSYSYLHFTNVLWPELTTWDLLWVIFKYQWVIDSYPQCCINLQLEKTPLTIAGKQYLEKIQKQHWNSLENIGKFSQ